MISSIIGGHGMHVAGGWSGLPYIAHNPTNPMTGMVRVNGSNLEAFTGSSWMIISQNTVQIELDAEITEIVKWAERKMIEEERLEKLAAQVPAVADLKSKLDMMIALTKDYNEA